MVEKVVVSMVDSMVGGREQKMNNWRRHLPRF
jgi:hypothetical protein